MHLLSIATAILFLAALGFLGVSLLRRLCVPVLNPLEIAAYGLPLGIVLGSLAILAIACVAGLHPWVAGLIALASVAAAITIHRRGHPPEARSSPGKQKRRKGPRSSQHSERSEGVSRFLISSQSLRMTKGWMATSFGVLPAIILSAFAIRWAIFWWSGYSQDATGIWAGNTGFWADWSLHIGDVMSFARGENFPPEHPRYAGGSYSYHYLTSITAAAMVQFGVKVTTALTLQSFLLTLCILLGLYAFARRLTNDNMIAAIAVVLFLLGGTLGWVLTLSEMNTQQSVLDVLENQPWNAAHQESANFRFQNVFFSLLQPQRSFLYGVPLGLLILTLLFEAVKSRQKLLFILAGIVGGLLPFANLSTLLSLALISPFLFLLFPSRGWLFFFGVWAAIGLPQVLLQQGGGAGAAAAFRTQIGWIAPPDSWSWFWLKNLGLFLPLLVIAWLKKELISSESRRFLLAFMPLFVAANLFVFQPWDWDNTKILLYWFLACSILVAALLVDAWRGQDSVAGRFLIAVAFLTIIGSGLLANLNQLLGKERQLLLTGEETEFASLVESATLPDSLIAVGLQHNHPVPMLSGRRVMMSYPGWLWSQGFDYRERESDLRAIFSLAPDASQQIEKYGIDYVVIGPNEISQLGANRAAFSSRHRSVARTPNYELFAVAE